MPATATMTPAVTGSISATAAPQIMDKTQRVSNVKYLFMLGSFHWAVNSAYVLEHTAKKVACQLLSSPGNTVATSTYLLPFSSVPCLPVQKPVSVFTEERRGAGLYAT